MQSSDGLDELDMKVFKEAVALIYQMTGISIADSRLSMVQGRLRKRALALKCSNYRDYLEVVRNDSTEAQNFIDRITTNETYFFRTPRIWDHLENNFIPNWIRENPSATFFAWSAAASSGEEAHSLGILLQSFREKNAKFDYKILGTDISAEMINLCRKGRYKGRSIENFKKTKPDIFSKYMVAKSPLEFEVKSEIKDHLDFRVHNLFKPYNKLQKFDLVLLRNVLIYFQRPDQEKVLSLIEPQLKSKGCLIIGESESLSNLKTNYQQLAPIIYSLGTTSGKAAA